MSKSTNPVFRCGALLSAFALVGCASVADVKPGTSYGDVTKQFGKPSVSCAEPGGGTRAVWTEQPSGEYAWAIVVGSDDVVSSVTQVMNREAFAVLNQGQWDMHAVKCHFGPPAQVQSFQESVNDVVWEYRFFESDYEMLYVYFDRGNNQVTKFNTGPDPDLNVSLHSGR
jgi:hypothetical protein